MSLRAMASGDAPATLDARETSASVAIPIVANSLFNPPTVVAMSGPITYNPGTGEVVFLRTGIYTLVLMINASTSGNRILYTYASLDTGSGYSPIRYSARETHVGTQSDGQVIFTSTNLFNAGNKLKFYLWADSACSAVSTDLPGTTPGTLTVPAYRLLYTSM